MTMLGGQTPCRFCGLTAGHTFMCPAPDMVRQNEEIAALKQQLADVTRERDEAESENQKVLRELENDDQNARHLRVQLAAAQASEALLLAALDKVMPWLEREVGPQYSGTNSEGLPVEREIPSAEEACGMAAMVLRAALATPPSDAVKRIMAMERACEAVDTVRRLEESGLKFGCGPEATAQFNAGLKLTYALSAYRALTTTKEHGDDA